MLARRLKRPVGALALATALAGCEAFVPVPGPTDDVPLAAPILRPEEALASVPPGPPSQASRDLARHYAQVETDLRARGLLQTGDARHIEVDAAQLADLFAEIALQEEYVPDQGLTRATPTLRPVTRWASPVRVSMTFGSAMTQADRRADRLFAARTVTRLARVSGHPIALNERRANFHVFVVGHDDRDMLLDRAKILNPGLNLRTLAELGTLPRDVNCVVWTFARPGADGRGAHEIVWALAVIRAELSDAQRQSCYHEELAQGLGLTNDSPRARPSVFNDDEEFATLTHLDEDLLRILYNPGLNPGMPPQQARQRARAIAAGLRDTQSEGG